MNRRRQKPETLAVSIFLPFLVSGIVTVVAPASRSMAQSGGPYHIARSVIAGGGTTDAGAGVYDVGSTIGQSTVGIATGSGYGLNAGFWGAAPAVQAFTPTATAAASPTRTASKSPSPLSTATAPPTPRPSGTPTGPLSNSTATPTATLGRSATPTLTVSTPTPSRTRTPAATTTPPTAATPSRTTTASPTPERTSETASPTPPAVPCVGDCNGDGMVSVDELVRCVSIALAQLTLAQCPALDTNHEEQVTVDELVAAVEAALGGCDED